MSRLPLFLGFEANHNTLRVVALDTRGELALRARFPLRQSNDVDLDFGPAADIAACLTAFLTAHHARAVVGASDHPQVLAVLGHHLGAPVRPVSRLDLSLTALEPGDGDAQTDRFGDALRMALLGALAAPALEAP